MAHSFCNSLIHYVFSTKLRRKHITPELQERLWPYMGGIARENGMKAFAVGGVEDHAHLLIALPGSLSVAKAIQLIKGGSSKWVHDTFAEHRAFEWQEGYGAFSIGMSGIADTVAYIERQPEHLRTKTFEEEFLSILKQHRMAYDERYIWG